MAAKLQTYRMVSPARRTGSGDHQRAMNKDFQVRTTAVLLAILTVAAMAFAWINLQQERLVSMPTDGVWWVEHDDHLHAERLHAQGPGERAGIKVGDQLTAINGQAIPNTSALMKQLYR